MPESGAIYTFFKKMNILIYRLGSLGDTILALPCFHAIREAYPTAKITLLTNQPVSNKAAPLVSILGEGYFFDEVLDYPIGTRSLSELYRIHSQIRVRNFDFAINLTEYRSDLTTLRDLIFLKSAAVKRLVGFNLSQNDKNPQIPKLGDEVEWEASRLARRLQGFAKVDLTSPKAWDLRLCKEERDSANRFLSLLPPARPTLAFSVGTKVQSKDWEIENWRGLVKDLSASLPYWNALFVGSSNESDMTEACRSEWAGSSLNLCGKTSPRETAALFQGCKLFVGHDSGPMHLAACVGVPCVGIFSARNLPRQWYPRGDHNRILYHTTECAGCGLEICVAERKKCILSITKEEVAQAVLGLIKDQNIDIL
jgi:heptosyltransferase III